MSDIDSTMFAVRSCNVSYVELFGTPNNNDIEILFSLWYGRDEEGKA